MSLLADTELRDLIANGKAVTASDGPDRVAIEAASVDFRVGRIFVPDLPADEQGKRERHALKQGETIAVETLERFDLPPDIGAITFPPSRVAFRGLLVTNPGHIDPGYKGPMRFMAINMGRDPYVVEVGAVIATAMLFRMSQPAENPYDQRHPPRDASVTPSSVLSMSPDFLDITKRAESAAQAQVAKVRNSTVVTVIGAFALPLLTLAFIWRPASDDSVSDLRNRITQLNEKQVSAEERWFGLLGGRAGHGDVVSLREQLKLLSEQLTQANERLAQLERQQGK